MTRKIIPLFSDTHAGHKLGLMNPNALIWDSSVNPPELVQVPRPNAWQELMWEDYIWGIEETKKLADGDEIIPFHVGDITQGSKYPSHLISLSSRNQSNIAYWNMAEWTERENSIMRFELVSGTPSHIGFEGTNLLNVYEAMTKEIDDLEVQMSHHAMRNVGKEWLDIAHHGPGDSKREWLKGNQLRYYLKDIFHKANAMKEICPRVVVRGHYHTPNEETITEETDQGYQQITGIILPSFSGVNGYARQATKSVSHVTNGMCCLEIIDGRFVEAYWFTRTRDVRNYGEL